MVAYLIPACLIDFRVCLHRIVWAIVVQHLYMLFFGMLLYANIIK